MRRENELLFFVWIDIDSLDYSPEGNVVVSWYYALTANFLMGKMDFITKTLILFYLVACVSCVQGVKLPKVDNLLVTILDEEVFVHWKKPTGAPPDVRYNVEFARFAGKWEAVTKCAYIAKTRCYLSDLIKDYSTDYKVRVQLTAGDAQSDWTAKKVLPNSSELQSPTFTMWATSGTLTVHIHQKPVLKQIFQFGITYSIYLEEKEKNKTTTAYLKDNQNEHVFTSLHWGKEYCVSVQVEENVGLSRGLSSKKCLVLPEQEWIIVAVTSMSVASLFIVIAVIAICMLCYINHPEKTPPALKSPVRGWHPLTVQEGPVEVVTDKGWFLFKAEPEVEQSFQNLPTTYDSDQQSTEEDRRPSTDSGVSIKSTSHPTRREDSGCGSIGVQDSVCGNFPIQDEGSDTLSMAKNDDSGMGLSCHSDACSVNLEELDSGCLNKSGKYHSQRLFTVSIHESENDYIFKEKLPEPQLVSVVSGYRTNTSFCTCSGASLCVWCHNQSNYKGKHKGLLQSDNIVESYSSYCSNQIDNMDQTDTNFTMAQMEQTFPMLTSLSSFPLMEKAQDHNMNDVSISLCDVELNNY